MLTIRGNLEVAAVLKAHQILNVKFEADAEDDEDEDDEENVDIPASWLDIYQSRFASPMAMAEWRKLEMLLFGGVDYPGGGDDNPLVNGSMPVGSNTVGHI